MNDINHVKQWIDRVKEAYLADDHILTSSLLEKALAETDSAPQLLEIAGMVAYKRGDITEAVRLIEAAMFEIGLSISAQLTLAKAWIQVGKTDAAKITASFLVEIAERIPYSMLAELTHLLARLQEYELAITVCRTACERHPSDDHAVFGLAFYMYRAGYPLNAVKNTMLKAIDLAPTCQLYQLNIAVVYCSLDQWESAYSHACRLSAEALSTIPCQNMVKRLVELFTQFGDYERLNQLDLTE